MRRHPKILQCFSISLFCIFWGVGMKRGDLPRRFLVSLEVSTGSFSCSWLRIKWTELLEHRCCHSFQDFPSMVLATNLSTGSVFHSSVVILLLPLLLSVYFLLVLLFFSHLGDISHSLTFACLCLRILHFHLSMLFFLVRRRSRLGGDSTPLLPLTGSSVSVLVTNSSL